MSSRRRKIYFNPSAGSSTCSPITVTGLESFHRTLLPNYVPTPLVALPDLAHEIGVKGVFIKDESNRFGLPSFKILGASWGVFRGLTARLGLDATTSLEELSRSLKSGKKIALYTATEGNHGRAVAFVAKRLGLEADVYVSNAMPEATKALIAGHGASVHVVQGDYDVAVAEASRACRLVGENGLLVQDTSFEGYEEIPAWIVQGYSTLLNEAEAQLADFGLQSTVVVTPVGVGSLATAVATHCKSRKKPVSVVAVEPDTAACLYKSLEANKPVSIKTSPTIMNGMCCGTLSAAAWESLSTLVDASVTVSDYESHTAVQYLGANNVSAGPCGAAALAALKHLASTKQNAIPLDKDAVVVLLSTEGPRPYSIPADVSVDDPIALTQTLVQIDSSNPTLSATGGAGETKIADYMAAWFEHRDIENHRIETNPGRPSIVAVHRGIGGGKSLMLNGHTDTVTLASYEQGPLSGGLVDRNGQQVILGRGSLDMKGGLAAALTASLTAKDLGVSLRGDIIVAAVSDEEDASLGTKDVIDAGWRADAAVIPEPTQRELIVAHKGFIHVEVDILGIAAHGSMPWLGVDSIMHAGWFLAALEEYQQMLPTDDILGQASLHCGLIRGGEEPSSYPAKTTVTLEFRTIPGQSGDQILRDMRALLESIAAKKAVFQFADPRIILSRPIQKLSPEHPFVKRISSVATPILGCAPAVTSMTFWADSALLSEAGIPTVVFGPSGEGLHAKEEFVTVESIRQTERVFVDLIKDFCQ
jgi:diaminopropionate ammonia-lyase family